MGNFAVSYNLVFILLIALIKSPYVTPDSPPNIILIVADDLGYNDVGFHGSDIHTPNLNELARNGVILENYYVQPSCSPSRSQLLTGRYGIRTGLRLGNIQPLQPLCLPLDEVTIAQKLKERNYKTHMLGKWHLGHCRKECTPTYRGFDSFYGIHLGSGDHYRHDKQSGYDFWRNENVSWTEGSRGSYSTTLYRNEALKIISKHDLRRPLFMYLSFQAPHGPLQVPWRWFQRYRFQGNWKRRIFAGMVTALDSAVGDLVQSLRKRGLWENTVLVFTTDNGGQTMSGGNNWPLRGGKGSLWEGGVRGVGFVHSPLINRPGRVSRRLMHISDWFPTLVRLSRGNLNGSKPLDGFDQWESITKNKASPRKEILHSIKPGYYSFSNWKFNPICRGYLPKKSFYCKPRWLVKRRKWCPRKRSGVCFRYKNGLWCDSAAIRVGKWKLLVGLQKPGNWEAVPNSGEDTVCSTLSQNKELIHLYDMKKDPLETTNLFWKYPKKVSHLMARLEEHRRSSVPKLRAKNDYRGNPQLNNGVWGPWLT